MSGYTESDLKYFKDREALMTRNPLDKKWFPVDNWPLYAGIVNIARYLSIYELVKKVLHVPGHFIELGCWNGTNLIYMAKMLKILKPMNNTNVYGFDSFKGLDNFSGSDKEIDVAVNYCYDGNSFLLKDIIDLYALNDMVTLVSGNIIETLPVFLEEKKDIRFSLVYLDADLYEPTKIGIELLWPKLLDGGIMVFDEFNDTDFPGETAAIHEVLGENVKLRSVLNTRQPIAYLVKE